MRYGVRQPTLMETGYYIIMDPHPDRKPNRDPRKVWMYECCSGKFAVNFEPRISLETTYYFENEQDFLMFKLRWEGIV